MSLFRSLDGLWRSTLLDAQPWLQHAFGTAFVSPRFPYRVLKQVHGTQVVDIEDHRDGLEADALVAPGPGQGIAVKTADCLPLLLADPASRVVAAVHAGWRGSAANIPAAAVGFLTQRYGILPHSLLAAAGPCIRACCFEVGPEVAGQFQKWLPERDDLDGPARIDLVEVTRRQLIGAGLAEENLDLGGPCTCCGDGEFHSWRRHRQTGCRMYSAIVRTI